MAPKKKTFSRSTTLRLAPEDDAAFDTVAAELRLDRAAMVRFVVREKMRELGLEELVREKMRELRIEETIERVAACESDPPPPRPAGDARSEVPRETAHRKTGQRRSPAR